MRRIILGLLSFMILFSGCESENAKPQSDIELKKEIQEINSFIQKNPIPFVKEYNNPNLGVRVFWTEISGTGKNPSFGDTLQVDYVARYLRSNWVLDTSIQSVAEDYGMSLSKRNFMPLEYIFGSSFGRLISGFEIVFPLMEEGDKVIAFFPSRYVDGNSGQSHLPTNAPLIFELELLEIKSEAEAD
ncbi:FKBP-type peptidyl-prolyl cis-trans isomerase [Shivajiella indica]|uniref:Peptidyl-prolyl cis-trans isomerase n=1 Tax=Shivajiella indica TaxID=872115 RepID=A0ABW5BG34_9BACT